MTTCGALKMLMWHVVCSASSQPFRPPGELHLGRGLVSSGSTMCSAMEQRVPSSSAPIMDCLNITASIARMLECPAQVSSNCVCVALVTLFYSRKRVSGHMRAEQCNNYCTYILYNLNVSTNTVASSCVHHDVVIGERIILF